MKFGPMLILITLLMPALGFSATLDQNLAALGKDLTRTVSKGREINLYHWVRGQTFRQFNSPNAYVTYLKSTYYAPAVATATNWDMEGPGIYTAIDPVATCTYGDCTNSAQNPNGPDWVLVQFVLVPGVKFLALNSTIFYQPTPPAYLNELQSQITAAGCTVGSGMTTLMEASATVPACQKIRDRLMQITGASAINYSYMAMTFTDCPNRTTQAAFVLFGDAAINWNRFTVFTPKLPTANDGHMENRLMIQYLFNHVTGPYVQSSYYTDQPWLGLKGQQPKTNMKNWMQQDIFGCGNWPEDK